MAYTDRLKHDYIEAEDLGLAVVKFANGAYGVIEGTVNVYPRNLEETLYLFGENGTVKLGGKSTNNIDVWNFADETEVDQANKGLEEACKANDVIYSGINTYDGKLTCKNVADSFEGYEYTDIRTLW